MKNEFKLYRRKQVSQLRPVTNDDIAQFHDLDHIVAYESCVKMIPVSISRQDRDNGSPKLGDMIARNPKDHKDQWLVSKQYFEDNFEPLRKA